MIHVIYYTRVLLRSAITRCRKGHKMHLEGTNLPENPLTAKSRVFTAMRKARQSAPPLARIQITSGGTNVLCVQATLLPLSSLPLLSPNPLKR